MHFRAFAGGFEEAYSKDSSGKAPLGLEVSLAHLETPYHRATSPSNRKLSRGINLGNQVNPATTAEEKIEI